MTNPPLPTNEQDRLEALFRYKVMDTLAETEFDDLVKLASQICEAPISLITLLDSNRQWFKSKLGMDALETPRNIAFCAYAILQNDVMVVEDALKDERFVDNPLVLDAPNIRFYAGMPLITPDNYTLGTLCVIDRTPRKLTELQLFALKTLGTQVIKLLEHKHKIEQIEIQKQQLNELNQQKLKLFSVISHDLRSPLNSLSSVLDLLINENWQPDKLKEIFEKLQTNVNQVQELTESILFWAQSQFQDFQVNREIVDLNILVQQIFTFYQGIAQQKSNLLEIKIPEQLKVWADKNILHLVLRNLVANAIKFTQNGTISISTFVRDNEVEISVSDTGLGIKSENLSKLFNWNKRYTTPGTAMEKGTGFGLLMCQEMLAQENTHLEVSSEFGKGSTFKFILPKESKKINH